MNRDIEWRAWAGEITIASEEEAPRIIGYAVVWDALSRPIVGLRDGLEFRELFRRGAFRKWLDGGGDAIAFWGHDSRIILGRLSVGTLELEEDDHGLRFVIHPPETTWGRDAVISVKRGDVKGASFAFKAVDDHLSRRDGMIVREVREAILYEVSPVAFPAYEQTEVSVRAIELARRMIDAQGGTISPQPQGRLGIKKLEIELMTMKEVLDGHTS